MAWLGTWAKRIKLDIDYTDGIGASVTHFPVSIHLKNANGDSTKVFEEITTNSRKFAIARSDATELKAEVEQWEYDSGTVANSVGIIHCSTGSWTINADESIYIYYDSSSADNPNVGDDPDDAASNAVWDSSFDMVQHMNDATTSTIKDSTTNSQDGAKYAANQPIEVDGEIGKAQDFDGTNDYVDLGIVPASDTFNLSFWLPDKGSSSGWEVYARAQDRDQWPSLGLVTEDSKFKFATNTGGEGYEWKIISTYAAITSGDYYFFNADWPSIKVYKNGSSTAILDTTSSNHFTIDPTTKTSIGRAGEYANYYFDGTVDEMRLSSVTRSLAWNKGSYKSGTDALLTYGTEETEEPALTGHIVKIYGVSV